MLTRAIIVLCRYGGLCCPSEVLKLAWDDIDCAESRFTVTSPKTKRFRKGYRVVPLFPEVRAALDQLFQHAEDGVK